MKRLLLVSTLSGLEMSQQVSM